MAKKSTPIASIAERYARALFDLAEDDRALVDMETDVGRFATLHEQSDDLRRFVSSPVLSAEEQTRAVAALLEKAEIGGLVGNFIKVVAANRRLFAMPEIIAAFSRLLAEKRGELTAEVTSAEPLSAKHAAELAEALKASLGKTVKLQTKVDPTLIGGLIVKVGSRMVDGSLRTKLNSLKLAMKEVG